MAILDQVTQEIMVIIQGLEVLIQEATLITEAIVIHHQEEITLQEAHHTATEAHDQEGNICYNL